MLTFVRLLRNRAIIGEQDVVVALSPCPQIPVRSLLTFRERALRYGVHGLENKHRIAPDSIFPTESYLQMVERVFGSEEQPPAYVVRYSRGWRIMTDEQRLCALATDFARWCRAGCYEPIHPIDRIADAIEFAFGG
jgi:hypothetical protein